MVLPLLALIAQIAGGAPAPPPDRLTLLFERGRPSQITQGGGRFELRAGDGWLRTDRVFLDFELTAEYRLTTADSKAIMALRTWASSQGWPARSYELSLTDDAAMKPSALLRGKDTKIQLVQEEAMRLRGTGEWQTLRVRAEGRLVTVTLNDALAGVYSVEDFGGHVFFRTTKGELQVRGLVLRPLTSSEVRPANALPAGGSNVDPAPLLISPEVLREVKPVYTPEAMRRGVAGVVEVEAVVLPDGTVGRVDVIKSLDPELDLSAVAAVKRWYFRPGTRLGKAVPVIVNIELTFTLRR